MTTEQSLEVSIAGPGSIIVCVTMEQCPPCTWLKPAIRKLANEFASSFDLIEADRDAASTFCKLYGIDRYPQMLAFRDGSLQQRQVGFDGLSATRTFVTDFLGLPAGDDPSERGKTFDAAYAHAKDAMNKTLEPASIALDPHMEEISPEVARLEQRVADTVRRGELAPADAGDALREGYALLYAPFQAKVDALRQAQTSAMQAFETLTAEGLRAYVDSAAGSTAICASSHSAERMPALKRSCDPGAADAGVCRIND